MSVSFFAPDFKIAVQGQRLASDVAKSVLNLTVMNEPDTLDHFSFTLANPYPRMRWTHTSDATLFKEGSSVTIDLGYVDDLERMFEGEITSISPAFPESGVPTVRVEGHTRMHWLQGSPMTRTFQNVSDKDIAEQIGRELSQAHNTSLDVKADETFTKHPYVIQYNQTDLAFLFERAKRIGFGVSVQDKTLVFCKVKNDQRKVCTFIWGRAAEVPDRKKKIFPLRSFYPTMNTLRQVSQVTVRGYDPKSGKEVVGRAGENTVHAKMGGTRLGPEVAAQALGGKKEDVRVNTPVASEKEAEQLAKAIYNDRALEFVTGNGASIGLPDLRAGRVITITGLGRRFDGDYYLTQATHSISNGGYGTSFSVRKNSIG